MPAGESSHGANPLRKQKVEVCKNIVEMCKNILWTGAKKMKKISQSKTDGKTRNSSWPKVTTHLSNMAVLLLWVSEWVIWLSCILPDEDQTIGRDSKKKKKKSKRPEKCWKQFSLDPVSLVRVSKGHYWQAHTEILANGQSNRAT